MKNGKKWLSLLLALLCAVVCAVPMWAAVDNHSGEDGQRYSVVVGLDRTELDLSGLPCEPYYEGTTLMVPLRLIAEALGYTVSWNAVSGAITVDDDYIQDVTLYDGSAAAAFSSHLKVIDMSRELELEQRVRVIKGYTFVPLAFFSEFFNDVSCANGVIAVAPSVCELDVGA